MSDFSDLDRALRDYNETHPQPAGYAYLGNNAGLILPADSQARRERRVYIHYGDGTVGTAILDERCKIPYLDLESLSYMNIRVELQRDRGLLYVIRTAKESLAVMGGETVQEKLDAVNKFPQAESIQTLRVTMTNPAGLSVWVHGPAIVKSPIDDSRYYIEPQSKVNLASAVSALTSGQHRLACICYDADAGAFTTVLGPVESASALPSRASFTVHDIIDLSIWEYIPLGVVYLYYGQTAIEEADFYRAYPMRPFMAADTKFHLLPTALSTNLHSGSFAAERALHRVVSESGYTDDLSYISPALSGQLLVIQAEAGHTITVKHGVANIFLNGEADFALSDNKSLLLAHDGDNWSDVGAGGGGGPGGSLTVAEQDGSPSATASTLNVPNGAMVNEGDGVVSIYFPTQGMWSFAGVIAIGAHPFRIYNLYGGTRTITKVQLHVQTAPTGAAIIVDIHKNGTTIFTTQSNRPQIAATANDGNSTTIEVASWADGEYLEAIIDQVGSTVAGVNLAVYIAYR